MTEKQYAKHPNSTYGKGISKAWELIDGLLEDVETANPTLAQTIVLHKQTILQKLAVYYPCVRLRKEVLFVGTYQEVCDFHDEFHDPHDPVHAKHLVMETPAQYEVVCNLYDMKRRQKPAKRK